MKTKIELSDHTAVTVVLASDGYPNNYEKGQIIRIENNEEIYSINLPESKGADFNQNIIAGKRAIKNLLKEIDDKGLLGLN